MWVSLAAVLAAEGGGASIGLSQLVGVILSAGGGAFVLAVVTSFRDLRSGVAAGRREVVRDLIEWRDEVEAARHNACLDRDFWRDLAAERGGQLREAGIVPANAAPVPPSLRMGAVKSRRPRGRRPVENQEREEQSE